MSSSASSVPSSKTQKMAVGGRTPLSLYVLNGFSFVGLVISVILTQHFYDVRNGTAGFKSFCNISEAVNCDVVAASPYAELFMGFPLSSFSAGWFLAILITSLIAHHAYWRRESVRALFGLIASGSLIGIVYFFLMLLSLKTYCLLCLALDGVNLVSLGLVWSLKPEGFSVHKPDLGKWKAFLAVISASVILSVIGLKSLDKATFPDSQIDELADNVLKSPVVSVNVSEDLPAMGAKDAPITVVEFSDFQCPFCRMAAFSLNSILNRYPGKIRIYFRNYPLDASCNPQMQQSMHPVACEAAKAALCAHKQGKFEVAYEELFQKQTSFGPGVPAKLEINVGVDGNQLEKCMSSPEISELVSRDIAEGNLLGVKSTPIFFINGHKMEGAYPAAVWDRIIQSLLKQ